jgi:hypothetical protein
MGEIPDETGGRERDAVVDESGSGPRPANEATKLRDLSSYGREPEPAARLRVDGSPQVENSVLASDLGLVGDDPLREAGDPAHLRRQRRDQPDTVRAMLADVVLPKPARLRTSQNFSLSDTHWFD